MDYPQLLTPVTVLGFSEGGSNLCTTQGVVSRIDMFPYAGYVSLPVIQIDAAINCGSSGGPALCGHVGASLSEWHFLAWTMRKILATLYQAQ